ncbi:MAG: segregation and condensation protein A [Dissulfurispiraceae bacterium]
MADSLDAYSIKVPSFEGPLDLLLHLIKQNKIEIYDIPIALITGQYLEYIGLMKELNLEVASEFLVMAATLIYIKSRMLLPPDEIIGGDEQEDPRAGLVERLLEYQAFKEASIQLKEREDLWVNVFPHPPENSGEVTYEPELYLFEVNLFDLLDALKKVMSSLPPETLKITRETLTVQDRIAVILEKMEGNSTVRFDDFFEKDKTKLQIIVTFLALLEILRLKLAVVYQNIEFGTIWIIRNPENSE